MQKSRKNTALENWSKLRFSIYGVGISFEVKKILRF
jgi:hypothetical protein